MSRTQQFLQLQEKNANSINFRELLEKHKERTERDLPFTLYQVEDAIFVGDQIIVALEYIFYQEDGNYVEIEETPAKELYQNYPLATENYKTSDSDFVQAFRNKPMNLRTKEIMIDG